MYCMVLVDTVTWTVYTVSRLVDGMHIDKH